MHQNDNISAAEVDRLLQVARAELRRQAETMNPADFHNQWADVDGMFDLRALVVAIRTAVGE